MIEGIIGFHFAEGRFMCLQERGTKGEDHCEKKKGKAKGIII